MVTRSVKPDEFAGFGFRNENVAKIKAPSYFETVNLISIVFGFG